MCADLNKNKEGILVFTEIHRPTRNSATGLEDAKYSFRSPPGKIKQCLQILLAVQDSDCSWNVLLLLRNIIQL